MSDKDRLPSISRQQARVLVVGTGLFWAMFPVLGAAVQSPLGLVAVGVAMASVTATSVTLLKVWGMPLFIGPGPGFFAKAAQQNRAMSSLFRPRFIGAVLRATGWPRVAVAAILAVLFLAAFASMFVFPAGDRESDGKGIHGEPYALPDRAI